MKAKKSPAERPSRSMLFVPGSNAAWLSTVQVYGADYVMFDLEDSVSVREKDTARLLVHEALKSPVWAGVPVVVRVNAINTPFFRDDLEAVVSAGVAIVRLPMVTDAQMIRHLDAELGVLEGKYGSVPGTTRILAAVESASGVVNAVAIATASPRMMGIALAAYDYAMDMHTTHDAAADESQLFFARCAILHAARVAKIHCYDVIYADVNDTEGFLREVAVIKKLGFDGKSLVNPRQIEPLHNAFAPTPEEVERAHRVVAAAVEAEKVGMGVVALDGKMIDAPIIAAAHRTIRLAQVSGVQVAGGVR
ncbi:aldolase/citrate lyase family protein [Propioniciclava tarda]|nr:aldolase/citrate lyase family protein [Propioniciclava tarda]SMO63648.1 citrate lyase subunit beta / citryl-CoA lyase [Propioniciclava tarda]